MFKVVGQHQPQIQKSKYTYADGLLCHNYSAAALLWHVWSRIDWLCCPCVRGRLLDTLLSGKRLPVNATLPKNLEPHDVQIQLSKSWLSSSSDPQLVELSHPDGNEKPPSNDYMIPLARVHRLPLDLLSTRTRSAVNQSLDRAWLSTKVLAMSSTPSDGSAVTTSATVVKGPRFR